MYAKLFRTLTPLVCQQRRRLGVGRLNPGREQTALVRLVPQVLVQVRVGDLLERFHVVDRHQMTVQVHEFDTALGRDEKSKLTARSRIQDQSQASIGFSSGYRYFLRV